MKCLIAGCKNCSHHGGGVTMINFLPDGTCKHAFICSPCYKAITTGDVSCPTTAFWGKTQPVIDDPIEGVSNAKDVVPRPVPLGWDAYAARLGRCSPSQEQGNRVQHNDVIVQQISNDLDIQYVELLRQKEQVAKESKQLLNEQGLCGHDICQLQQNSSNEMHK